MYAFSILPARPAWQRKARRRFAASITLATLVVAAFIGLVRFTAEIEAPFELEVQLLSPEPFVAPEPVTEAVPVPELIEPQPLEAVDSPSDSTPDTQEEPQEPAPQRDWYSQMDEIVAATVASQQKVPAVNPAFDQRRRQAAVKFAPSKAPRKKPIWENVETDQLGRKILVSGDCYRVIDDPSAVNYEIFCTFQQYIIYCSTPHRTRQNNHPWVKEMRDRYDYLAQQESGGDSLDSDHPIIVAEYSQEN